MTPPIMLAAGLGAIFVAGVLILALVGAITTERHQVARSLAAVEALHAAPRSMRPELDRPFADRVLGPGLQRFINVGRRLTPADRVRRIRHRLDLAGNPAGWDVDRIVALKALFGMVGVVVGAFLPPLLGVSALTTVALAVGLGAGGWFGPTMWLYQKGYDRSQRIRAELPDSLDLLTISVEAGLAFDAALAQVARNAEGPLAEEFFRVLQEMQIGTGRVDAMRALGERTDVPELRSFIGAMVQADSFGIPVARVLRVLAREMRVKRSQRAEEAAQKVPVKILFPLIICILPALFVVVIGPAAVNAFHAFRGL